MTRFDESRAPAADNGHGGCRRRFSSALTILSAKDEGGSGAGPHPIDAGDARPLGLILNELVVNALKHAFPGDRAGTVRVDLRRRGDEHALTVLDDGVGMDPASPPRGTRLGRRMARALAAQLGGELETGPGEGGTGTRCTVRWPAA